MQHGDGTSQRFGKKVEIGASTICFGRRADALPGAARSERAEMAAATAVADRRRGRRIEDHVGQLAAGTVRTDLRSAVDEDLEADPAAEREQGEIAMLADEAMAGGGDVVEQADRHAGQARLEQAVQCERTERRTLVAPQRRQRDDAAFGVDRARKGGGDRVDGVVAACIVDFSDDEVEDRVETLARTHGRAQQMIRRRPARLR